MRNLNDQQVNEHSLKWPKIDSFGERRERPEVVRSRSHLKPTPDPGEDSRGGNHRVNVYNRTRKGQRAPSSVLFFFEIDLVEGGCFTELELEVAPSRARPTAELLFKTASRLPDLAAGVFVDKRGDCCS